MCLPVRCGCTVSPVTAPRSRRRCWPPPDTGWWRSTTTTTPPPRDWTSRQPTRNPGEPRPAPVRNGERAMMALTVVLAVLVGVALGLLGGGGSILMVPLLAYAAGMDAKHAIATSLLVVGIASVVGVIAHARAGRVRWRTAVLCGVAGMAGAYAGGRLAHFIPGTVLMIAFAAVMVAAAIAMLRGRNDTHAAPERGQLPWLTMIALTGGPVGAGGGFLLVPALALLGGLEMPAAVGTSLVVIAMQSFAGLAGHLAHEHIDWPLAAMVTAATVIGAVIGGRLTAVFKPDALRIAFGWVMLVMAAVVLAQETAPAVGIAIAAGTVVAAVTYLTCRRTTHCPLRIVTGRARAIARG